MKAKRCAALTAATALMVGLATTRAQVPVPPTGPIRGAAPVPPPGIWQTPNPNPAAGPQPELGRPFSLEGGPIHRAFRHTSRALHDYMIGYPEYFSEPPLGGLTYEMFHIQASKADGHQFMLYRSDFVDGTTQLSPGGAQRLTQMSRRLPGWLGPVVVEWSPDRPGLAESRRDAVVALLEQAGLPVVPERVVVGPSPYNGMIGADAAFSYDSMLLRDRNAGISYPVPPLPAATAFGAIP